MTIGKKIKKVRENKGMPAKEVTTAADIGSAMYSRIENGVNDPSLTTLEKIAKALGIKLSALFDDDNQFEDINSYNAFTIEKVRTIELLSEDEKKTVFSIVDAFAGKKKLKDALSNVLQDVN